MALTATFSLQSSGNLTKDDTVSVVTDSVANDTNSFPSLSIDLTDGTGADQANKWYRKYVTLGASASTSIDLIGSTDTDPFGQANNLTRVVAFLVAIVDPDGTKAIRVGPQGGANPFVGPFNASTAYLTVKYWHLSVEPSATGWAVTGGSNDTFHLNNPSASSVSFVVWILGS
jgi:hypothetical protein